MIKRLLITLTATLAILAGNSHAQISVPAGGAGPFDFATRPTDINEWATVSVAGAGATYLNPTALEGAARNMDAIAINQPLGTSASVNPITGNALARHNSTLLLIQSLPTGNAATYLKATLRNDTGAAISALRVTYDFGVD